MEIESLEGNIIGIIGDVTINQDYNGKVEDIVLKKTSAALKMVGLSDEYLDKDFNSLSNRDKNKVILASKLQDKVIILKDFSKGLLSKDIEFFKNLFKKISGYNRKIILIDKNSNLFLRCVSKIYVINNKEILYETDDVFDFRLSEYIDLPKIVTFVNESKKYGVSINRYQELDELLKAIYRIKS